MNTLQYIDQKHYPHLDGIRGLALVLVLLAHFYHFRFGFIGIDCFFVLSGFLITRILLTTPRSLHAFFNFMMRRFLRIFPMYYLVLFFVFLLFKEALLERIPGYQNLLDNQIYFWMYLQNIYIVGAQKFETLFLRHFWSLAIEEQFYIFWPIILFLFQKKHKILIPLLVFIIIGSGLLKTFSTSFVESYMLIQYRIDCILCGALVAFSLYYKVNYSRNVIVGVFLLLLIAFIFLGFVSDNFSEENLITPRYIFSVTGYMFGALILISLMEGKFSEVIRMIFSHQFFVFAGKYSYTIFIIHWPILLLVGTSSLLSFVSYQYVRSTIIMLFCIVLGILIYHIYEKHFLLLKKYFPADPGKKMT